MFFIFNKDKIISVLITFGIVIVLFCVVAINPKISENSVPTSSNTVIITDNEDIDN